MTTPSPQAAEPKRALEIEGRPADHAVKTAIVVQQTAAKTAATDGKEEEIRILLQKQVSKVSIAKTVSVSRTALHHFIDS